MPITPPKAGTLRKVPVADLKPYPGNARRGDVDAIAASLEAHGQYKPIVANTRDLVVLAGNHTLQAAEKLGWKELRVFFVDVDELEAARINLIDNRTNDLAGYDTEALVAQLQALPDLEATGYDAAALEGLLGELADDPEEGQQDPDDVPALAASRVDAGDLWQMGEHFLICGDASHGDVLEKLMGDELAAMLWADPPYNVDYEGKTADALTILNDKLPDSEFFSMLLGSLEQGVRFTVEGGGAYICHPDVGHLVFLVAFSKAGWRHAQDLIWVKDRFVLGRKDYQVQHEPILYGWRPGAGHRWYGGFDKTTVIDEEADPRKLAKPELVELVKELRNERATSVVREDKPARSELHPIQKPVELVERHLRNSSIRGDVVLDLYGGSGTTAIAAERLGRQARLVELDPAYCDVILKRWEDFTGRKARLRKSR